MILVLLLNVAATWAMVGLIWFVQIVHYPLYARVGEDVFAVYEATHNRVTTWVVGPPMLVEALTAGLLLARPGSIPSRYPRLGILLLFIIWGSTALLQVPQHEILTRGFTADAYHVLVTSNWIRTVAWTLRGVLALLMVECLLRKH